MNEVSCKALWLWFEVARDKGTQPDWYVQGLPVSAAHIKDGSKRIDWDVYCQLLERLENLVGGPAALERTSQDFSQAPSMRVMRAALGLVTGPRAIYWAAHRWFGHAFFTIVESSFADLGPNELELKLRIPDGFRDSPSFLRMNAGVFRSNPRILGLADAQVDWTLSGRLGVYRVRLPQSMTVAARFKRSFSMLFSAGAALNELGAQQDEIKQKYHQLNATNRALEVERNTVQVLLDISQAAQEKQDLDHVVTAITKQLKKHMALSAVETIVDVTEDNVHVSAACTDGEFGAGASSVEVPIQHAGRQFGRVRASAAGRDLDAQERQLVQRGVEVVASAIDSAVSYAVIQELHNDLEDRVVERTAQLESALTQVKHQQEARQRIFQNISHELRTPLSLIGLSTGDIEARDGDHLSVKTRERLGQIDDAVTRLLHLFDGMLLLAAGQEGKLRLKVSDCDLGISLRSLVSAWSLVGEKNSIRIQYDGPDRLRCRIDEQGIERAVSNLLSNAIKFTTAGGTVQVRLNQLPQARLEISVSDTGVGMDGEFLKRAFGRFEQGPAPVRPGERGSGIGLAIVKEIAEAHGGIATVKSDRGHGSTFTLVIPRDQDAQKVINRGDGSFIPAVQAPIIARGTNGEVIEPQRVFGNHEFTILVAEDEPQLRTFLVELLSREYNVISAPDGLAALSLAQEHMPHLLLSDVGMPGITGIELTKRFRQMTGFRLSPVILLTAYAMTDSRLDGLEAGAVDYVTKPFHPGELLARIRGQLELRKMALRLHETQKLAGLGVLAAGLAHELRNPATGVVSAIEPLKKLLPPEAKTQTVLQLLEAITLGSKQLEVLTRQLIGFTRQGPLEVRPEPLTGIIETAEGLARPTLEARSLTRQMDYAGLVRCSRGLVIQVLVNLFENAAHATPPESEIRVHAHENNGVLCIDVQDQGLGVKPGHRDRLFDPFFTTKEPGKGTGLGLTVSRLIAERHGGTLKLLDTDRGATFRLELPLNDVKLPLDSPRLMKMAGAPV